MKRALVVSFVALAIGVAWAPAAVAAPVSVEQYVNNVCTSMTTFQDAGAEASQAFQDSIATLTKVPAVKKEFVAFFDSLHDAVTQLQADLAAAGRPQVDDGAKMAKQLRREIAEVEEVVADARDTAASLKTAKPTQFANNVTALGEKLDKALSGIGDGIGEIGKQYDDSGLDEAEQADPDCAALRS